MYFSYRQLQGIGMFEVLVVKLMCFNYLFHETERMYNDHKMLQMQLQFQIHVAR